MDLPYVSGFLFVRELPAYELLLRRLSASAPELEPEAWRAFPLHFLQTQDQLLFQSLLFILSHLVSVINT